MNQRILIVDDEEDICMILEYSLQQAGYETIVANSGEEALQLLLKEGENIQLVLLDIMMEKMSGIEMLQALRNTQSHIPAVIFLTALNTEANILKGFSMGADDYISKPFRISEVLARVGAVLRRTAKVTQATQQAEQSNCIVYEGICVNQNDMSLHIDGQAVTITRKEIDLLCYLLNHRGQILSREKLLNEVWDKNGYVLERTVDVHITHLRRKLGVYGKHIITKSGFGYMFEC